MYSCGDHEVVHIRVESSKCQYSHSSQFKDNLNLTTIILHFISPSITHVNVTSRFKFMEHD